VFFSLSGCKRAAYILPALPPLALALGCYLDVLLASERLARATVGVLRQAHRLAHGATVLVLAAAVACSLAAVSARVMSPVSGGALAAVAGLFCLLVWRRGPRGTPAAAWGLCGATTFLVLFAAIHLLLPGYARKFALRGPVRPQAEMCADPQIPVICYPHRWDSVSFYLQRNDVQAYAEFDELVSRLRAAENTLLVVKSNECVEEVVEKLPASLEFVPSGRQGPVTVGLVRHRATAPDGLFARR